MINYTQCHATLDSNRVSYKWKVLTGESEVTSVGRSGLSFAQLSYLFHSAPDNFILAYQQLLMLMVAGRPVIPQCECSVESINFGEAKQQPTAFAVRRWMRQTAESRTNLLL